MRLVYALALPVIVYLLGGCPNDPAGDQSTLDAPNAVDPGVTDRDEGTGILVSLVAHSETLSLDVYDETTGTLVKRAASAGELIELAPGEYRLTAYFNEEFVLAESVVVRAGEITRVPFGALFVDTIAGAATVSYDIYDALGNTLLDNVNDTDALRALPPGVYVLKEYGHADFEFARPVTVIAGETTTIPMGAIDLHAVSEAATTTYDIYDASGLVLLDSVNDTDVVRSVPPGEYVLKEYANDALVYASGVKVVAGIVTERGLGAIRYSGGESSYDIYAADGQTLLVRPASQGDVRSVPAGSYVLKDYFSDVVLSGTVTVTVNEITEVP